MMDCRIIALWTTSLAIFCSSARGAIDEQNDPVELTKVIIQARASLDFERLAALVDRNTLRVFRLSVNQMISRSVQENGEELVFAALGLTDGWQELEVMDHADYFVHIMEVVTLDMPIETNPRIEIMGTVEKGEGRRLVAYRIIRRLNSVPGALFYKNRVEEFVNRNGLWYVKGSNLKFVETYLSLIRWRLKRAISKQELTE